MPRTALTTVMLLSLLALANSAQAQQYVFRSVDVPGAAWTLMGGNNNAGSITGCYQIEGFSSNYAGVLLSNAAFKPVKYPKSMSTCLYGASNNGELAGAYSDSSGKVHGFTLTGKTYVNIDYSGAVDTYVNDVNNAGVAAGDYFDGSANHGFTWQGGTFTHIDFPGPAIRSCSQSITRIRWSAPMPSAALTMDFN